MKKSLRSWLWRVPVDQEVTDEIALHIDLRTRELIQGGMDPKSARELALQRMGDVATVKETCVNLGRKRDRGMRVSQWFEELRDDVKFAFRQLRAAPVFTAIAVTTLALGIGANSAIFALVDATLLRPRLTPTRIGWSRSGRLPTRTREASHPRRTCTTGTRAAGRSRKSRALFRTSAAW